MHKLFIKNNIIIYMKASAIFTAGFILCSGDDPGMYCPIIIFLNISSTSEKGSERVSRVTYSIDIFRQI